MMLELRQHYCGPEFESSGRLFAEELGLKRFELSVVGKIIPFYGYHPLTKYNKNKQ